MRRHALGALGLGAGLMVACAPPGQDETHMIDGDPLTQAISSDNGLQAVNGLTANNGLVANNGLMTNNGLSTNNGLRTNNGLAVNNGLMTNNGGRLTVKYMAKCALGAGDYMDKADNTGTVHRYHGGLGFGTGWKDGSCDDKCRKMISACMLAHLNSTGTSVPIWINADPDDAPQVGFGMAYQSNNDKNMQEGVYFGDVLAMNPPKAYYTRGNLFKGSIPGRLGASSSNPYKAYSGYRVDGGPLHTGVASPLCYAKKTPDNIHWDYTSCQKSSYSGGPTVESWPYTVTSYVNYNYSGAVSQNWSTKTLSFEDVSTGKKTNNSWEMWSYNGFDFSNEVNHLYHGPVEVAHAATQSTAKSLCVPNTAFLTITKNGGEPFSLVEMTLRDWFAGGNGGGTIKVRGYKKGAAMVQKDTWVGDDQKATVQYNWDGLIKVEVEAPSGLSTCVDDVKLKT